MNQGIPQIKSAAVSVAMILLGVPMATILHLYLSGELHYWSQIPDVLNHASFTAVMAAIAWIFLRSPFAGKFTEILQTTTTPSGKVTETSVKITEPNPVDGEKK